MLTCRPLSTQIMGMSGYTKLFSTILASTIWRAPDKTRILWITMLAMADKNGIVEGSIPGLADMARMTVDECLAALAALHAPDEYSRTKDYEGRRVATIDGGWQILNHAKYRSKMNADERREYFRVKQAEGRAKKRQHAVNKRSDSSTESTHAEAAPSPKADIKAILPKERTASAPSGFAVPPCFEKVDGFSVALADWIEHRKKIRKPPTGKAIQLLINRLAEHPEQAVKALDTIIENGWQSFKWEWLLENKTNERTKPNQRSNSTRNVGHNANLDYSKRTTKESPAGAYPGLKETLDAVFRGVPPEGQPKSPESAG